MKLRNYLTEQFADVMAKATEFASEKEVLEEAIYISEGWEIRWGEIVVNEEGVDGF